MNAKSATVNVAAAAAALLLSGMPQLRMLQPLAVSQAGKFSILQLHLVVRIRIFD